MAELAVTDGMPPPADLPRGECITTWVYDDAGNRSGLRVDQADPHILISGELLAEVTAAPAPGVSLTWPSPPPPVGRWLYVGALLKICGINRTVIYRITEYVPRVRGYIGEWPD